MNAIEFLLASFDDIWSHQWESTTSILEGVTPAEAEWQHSSYRDVEPEAGFPLPGTIAWHVAHLEYYSRFYTEVLRLRPVNDSLPALPSDNLTFPRSVEALRIAREGLRQQIALLSDSSLEEPCHQGDSVGEFLRAVLRHESWHGGQIALMRRLFREAAAESKKTEADELSGGAIILGLHHAQITVSANDVEGARQFYCGILGSPEVPKPDNLQGRGGFWFSVGDQNVHVGVEEGFDRTKTKAHLAYQVQNLDAWRTTLIEQGIEILDGIPIPGYNRFEFRDPFGNRVEFIESVL